MANFPAVTVKNVFNENLHKFNAGLALLAQHKVPRKSEIPLFKISSKGRVTIFPHYTVNVGSKVKSVDRFTDYRVTSLKKTFLMNRKTMRWAKPTRTITQTREVTMSKFIKEISSVPIADHIIRDMAQHIEAGTSSVIQYKECDTPESYVHQHQVRSNSCMMIGASYSGNLRGKVFRATGWWPSMIYHYHPRLKGVYIEKNGTPVARTLLILNANGSVKGYGCIYGATSAFRQLLVKELHKRGYREAWSSNVFPEFEVPAIDYKGRKLVGCSYGEHFGSYIYKYVAAGDKFIVRSWKCISPEMSKDGWKYNNGSGGGGWNAHDGTNLRYE